MGGAKVGSFERFSSPDAVAWEMNGADREKKSPTTGTRKQDGGCCRLEAWPWGGQEGAGGEDASRAWLRRRRRFESRAPQSEENSSGSREKPRGDEVGPATGGAHMKSLRG